MRRRTGFLAGAAVCLAMLVANCGQRTALTPTTIEITLVPEAAEGGADRLVPIEGRVRGAPPGTRVVLYAKSAVWWVQPSRQQPFTDDRRRRRLEESTHLGTEYAALLVGPEFKPPATVQELPSPGGPIRRSSSPRHRRAGPAPAQDDHLQRLRVGGAAGRRATAAAPTTTTPRNVVGRRRRPPAPEARRSATAAGPAPR